jgi:hypothetical protein
MPEINERLARLEAKVDEGFRTAERDRADVKEALDRYNQGMTSFMCDIKETLKDHSTRLDGHDTVLNQIKGGKKVLAAMWGAFLALWGILEGIIHFGRGTQK